MQPNQVSGQAIGTIIAVSDSNELSQLSTQGIAVGTKVYNIAVGQYFALTVSTATLVTDQVLSVYHIDNQRWIKELPGSPSWLNSVTVYVSPSGNDAHDGLSRPNAMLTGYAAYQQLYTVSGGQGGVLECDDGVLWGGPVSHQGCWLRDDGFANVIPGWLPMMPVTIRLRGGRHTQFGRPCGGLGGGSTWFDLRDDRFHPLFWVASSGRFPIVIENAMPLSGYANQIVRHGWDYRRANDGSIAFGNIVSWARGLGPGTTITNASRSNATGTIITHLTFDQPAVEIWDGMWFHLTSSSGSFTSGWYQVKTHDPNADGSGCHWIEYVDTGSNTTVANIGTWEAGQATLTVSPPTGTSITSCSRAGGVVRLNFAAGPQPARVGTVIGLPIILTSTDPNFPSGNYTVTNWDPHNTWIEYVDGGANHTGTTIGTWATHGVQPFDRIEVTSTSSEVPPTEYRALAVTASTITVRDPYGYGTRTHIVTVANPGQYVLQDRANYAAGMTDIINVNGNVSPTVNDDTFGQGPGFDFGGSTDGRTTVEYTSVTGYVPLTNPAPPDRACWLLADGGSNGSTGLQARHHRPNASGIRIYGGKVATWGILTDDVGGDTAITVAAPPALEVLEMNGAGNVYCRDTLVFDQPPGYPNIRFGNGFGHVSIGPGCGLISGLNATVDTDVWGTYTDSAIKKGQTGFWGGRVNADSPQPRRAFSPLTARYQNWVQNDPATWTLIGSGVNVTATATDGPQVSPSSGITPAWRLTRNSGTVGVYIYPQDTRLNPHTGSPVTHALGDRWIVGGWFRDPAGLNGVPLSGPPQLALNMAGANGNFAVNANAPFPGDGEWQWLFGGGTITTLDAPTAGLRIAFFAHADRPTASIDVMDPFVIRIPAGDMSDNEFAEYLLSAQSTDFAVPPGVTTTRPGQPFVASGGLGISGTITRTVGVGSGQLTLGSVLEYEPRFDKDGRTVIGWVPIYSATVNP